MLWSFDCWRLKSILGVCGCWYQPNSVLCSVSSEGGLAKVGEGWVEQQEVKSISYSIKISHSLSGIGSTFENLHLHISAHRYTSMSLHASRQSLVQPFPFSADNALVILFFFKWPKTCKQTAFSLHGSHWFWYHCSREKIPCPSDNASIEIPSCGCTQSGMFLLKYHHRHTLIFSIFSGQNTILLFCIPFVGFQDSLETVVLTFPLRSQHLEMIPCLLFISFWVAFLFQPLKKIMRYLENENWNWIQTVKRTSKMCSVFWAPTLKGICFIHLLFLCNQSSCRKVIVGQPC